MIVSATPVGFLAIGRDNSISTYSISICEVVGDQLKVKLHLSSSYTNYTEVEELTATRKSGRIEGQCSGLTQN